MAVIADLAANAPYRGRQPLTLQHASGAVPDGVRLPPPLPCAGDRSSVRHCSLLQLQCPSGTTGTRSRILPDKIRLRGLISQ